MARLILVAVIASTVSCLLTLAAVGVFRPSEAAAQSPLFVRAAGFEVVDHEGKLRAYFGLGHVDSAGLWIHDKGEMQRIELVHTYDDQARIVIRSPDRTVVWQAP